MRLLLCLVGGSCTTSARDQSRVPFWVSFNINVGGLLLGSFDLWRFSPIIVFNISSQATVGNLDRLSLYGLKYRACTYTINSLRKLLSAVLREIENGPIMAFVQST